MGAPLEEIGLAENVLPMGQLLLRSARRTPDKEALVFPDERLTYRELADRAWGVARSLLALGVQPGEHVGILMTNHPDLVATVFGASLIGAVVVPINARYRTTELRFDRRRRRPRRAAHPRPRRRATSTSRADRGGAGRPRGAEAALDRDDGRSASRTACSRARDFDAAGDERRRGAAAHPRRGRPAARPRR